MGRVRKSTAVSVEALRAIPGQLMVLLSRVRTGSNVVPGLCRAMYLAWMRGQIAQAQQLAMAVARVTAALQRDSDPAPVKYALSLVSPRVRLPLVELSSESRAEIDAVRARVCEKHPGYLIGKLASRDQSAAHSAGRRSRGSRALTLCAWSALLITNPSIQHRPGPPAVL